MTLKKKLISAALLLAATSARALPYAPEFLQDEQTDAGKLEYINFGNFDRWLIRNVKESGIIGGKTKTLYCIAPNGTITSTDPYRGSGGSPWATSNVMARVSGIRRPTSASTARNARATATAPSSIRTSKSAKYSAS